MRKILIFCLGILVLLPLIAANSIDIEFPNGQEFEAGEPITFKATLYDNSKNPLDAQIQITIEDSEKRITRSSASSKEVASVTLREDTSSGQGIIRAKYQETEAIAFFEIGRKELVRFELEEGKLIVTNIGNTPYSKTIKITIGETTGTQTPNLEIGESASYRLIAPEGIYNIRVTDGKTSLIRGGIQLTGTGNVVGAIDDSSSKRTGITGGVSPEEGDIALLSYIKNNKFIYVFVGVIFAAVILIAIERNYKRRVGR
ncbi:MAG: hypothetical protein ABIH59_03760 [archaeon]